MLMSFVFGCFVVRDLSRSGCGQNYYLTPPILFLSLPTILSARLKLVSVPFSSLVLYIGHLEKSFPESIM